jgi:hypothetical protein
MGNRAVITTEDKTLAVYLHYNGGRDSVEAFLVYCKLRGHTPPEQDIYGFPRFCQIVGNFFGGSSSIGICLYEDADTDNWNNGTYIIKDWEIVGREFFSGVEQNHLNFKNLLFEINEKQPESERLGFDLITDICRERGIASYD